MSNLGIKHLKLESKISELNAMRAHAEIVSGAYRLRKLQQGDSSEPSGWRDLTDDEKLKDKVEEMCRHITRVRELGETLITAESEEIQTPSHGFRKKI